MVGVRWFGLITQDTKESGSLIKHVERENSSIPTEIFMMALGLIIKQTVMVYTPTSKGLDMKVTGRMINKTVEGLKPGQKARSTKESMS